MNPLDEQRKALLDRLKNLEEFEKQLSKLPYVSTVAETLGDYNLYLSSFFEDCNDIKEIIQEIKINANVVSFEILFYSKDVSNPIIVPFSDGRPENSIIYKLRSKMDEHESS